MNTGPRAFPAQHADDLLAHAGWVRELARSLLRSDPHAADDLAQEACLAALERPARTDALAGWLAGALRNLVRQHRRGEGRRRTRERAVARAEGEPSALDLVERLAQHRAVVEAVATLDEPYRTVVLERFFDGRSVRAIARAQGVPVATVKTRLARALARLRARLDREHGHDGRTWALVLLPLARAPGTNGAAPWSLLLMSTPAKLAFAAVLVSGAALWSWSAVRAHPVAPRGAAPLVAERDIVAPPHEVDSVSAQRESPLSEREPESARPADVGGAPIARVRGRVLDQDGRSLGAARVWFDGGRTLPVGEIVLPAPAPPVDSAVIDCDARGEFECAAPPSAGRFLAHGERWTTVLAGVWAPAKDAEVVLVVAPRVSLAGRVVAEDGRPLAGVRVTLLLPRDLRARVGVVLDGAAECGWVARTDAAGAFALPAVPAVDGAELRAVLDGWITELVAAPRVSERALVLVLRRPTPGTDALAGQVLDERGAPVEAASVALGLDATTTDRHGLFELALPPEDAPATLVAVKRGHLPAFEPAPSKAGAFVVLHLGAAPLALAGRVVGADGKGRAGIHVFVADPTPFGALDEIPACVEGILAGAKTRVELEAALTALGADADPEAALFRTSTVLWPFERTDAEGRFHLSGLLPREYALSALDPDTLARVDAGAWAGADDVVITLPEVDEHPLVGRVVGADGTPVPGIAVVPRCDVITAHLDEHTWSTVHGQAAAALTDADGRFALEHVPARGVYLALQGAAILPLELGRGAAGGIRTLADRDGELRIVVERLRHLQIELASDGTADEVLVLDDAGARLRIRAMQGSARYEGDSAALREGRSDVLTVSERARTLVLLSRGAELRRVPLALAPGDLNLVRL